MFADIYRPELWHDFFLLVGTGAFSLTGLVFVGMSINLKEVTKDATHRYRAIGTLAGFTAVAMLCMLALMGAQDHRWIAAEWLATAFIGGLIFINGYVQSIKKGGSELGLSLTRVVFGSACYALQVGGAFMFLLNDRSGIYIAAVGLILNFYFMISGAWLLVVGPPSAH